MKGFTMVLILFFGVVSFVLATSKAGTGDGPDRDCFDPATEVWEPCGHCPPKVCGVVQPKGAGCQPDCWPRCECREGLIRESKDGPCIPESQCPSTKPSCGDNEEYSDCGTACEPTCRNPEPASCTEQCVAGCFCKDGFIRERSNGSCICKEECKRKC